MNDYHNKICAKLDALEKLAHPLLLYKVNELRIIYENGYLNLLKNETSDAYVKFIMSENLIECMDEVFENIMNYTPKPDDIDYMGLQKIVQTETKADLIKQYKEYNIDITLKKISVNTCSVCGAVMTLNQHTSEYICDTGCGQIIPIQGTLFEDAQIYTQNQLVIMSKTKKHDPNDHLSKWIDKIIARDDFIFPEEVITKINNLIVKEYTRGDRLRPMRNIQCDKFRELLKQCKYIDYYDHVPLLRKIITGMHGPEVVPPEMTEEEIQEILIESSVSMHEFEIVVKDPEILRRMRKEKVKNRFYYPYILWQIINLKIRDKRNPKILECIHLQRDETLKRNDIVWKRICEIRGYKFYSAATRH